VSIKKIVGILPVIISLLTLVSFIGGGLLGYIYRDRFYIEESKSSTKLLVIERKLGELDLEVKAVKEALDIASKKVQISEGIAQVITDLQPKLDVELNPNVSYHDGKIRLTFDITNLSKHLISVGEPEIILSTEFIWGKDATAGKLSPHVDYSLAIGSGGFYAAPGQTVGRIVEIKFLKAPFEELLPMQMPNPIYFYGSIDAETDPKIVEAFSGPLRDFLGTDKLYDLARVSYKLIGEFAPPESCYPE